MKSLQKKKQEKKQNLLEGGENYKEKVQKHKECRIDLEEEAKRLQNDLLREEEEEKDRIAAQQKKKRIKKERRKLKKNAEVCALNLGNSMINDCIDDIVSNIVSNIATEHFDSSDANSDGYTDGTDGYTDKYTKMESDQAIVSDLHNSEPEEAESTEAEKTIDLKNLGDNTKGMCLYNILAKFLVK